MRNNKTIFGEHEVIVRVDLSTVTVDIDKFPEDWALLGGRALSARILLHEVDPTCDPLGPQNKLVIAPGLLTGTSAPTSGRLSFGAKSPLTQGIKESNCGGNPGQHIAKMGIRALIIEGIPANDDALYGLELDENGARLVDAKQYVGGKNYETCKLLAEKYCSKASFIVVGPAGENGLCAASIACTDRDNRYPTRHAARGGLGAVMGSKGLKYIAVDPGKRFAATKSPKRKRELAGLVKQQSKRYIDGPQRMSRGTARAIGKAASLCTLPYKNRKTGSPPEIDVIGLDGATILSSFETRNGGMHNCMTGCIVKCSNQLYRQDNTYLTSALELETLGLLGSNCAIGKWEQVGELDYLCDDIGLDTMEIGVAIAIWMDAGNMEWGDYEGMRDLLRQIAKGTEIGQIVGNGAKSVGDFTEHDRVPVVKGQGIPVWDPRVMKATGVTYATSAMGADHTAGLVTLVGLPEDGVAALSQEAQILNAIGDSSGYCQFMQATVREIREMAELLLDRNIENQDMFEMGWQCLQDEWEFNKKAGFSESDDAMVEFMKQEPIGEWNYVYDVDDQIMQQVKTNIFSIADDFYDKPIF